MLVVGIDPGTGSSSPLGVVIVDFLDREILATQEFWSDEKTASKRIRDISEKLRDFLPSDIYLAVSEYFVMRGKGGETLARMVGAIIASLPRQAIFTETQNSTVKRIIGGHGRASKEEVAEGVLEYFSENERSFAVVTELLHNEQFDLLDALAIAICGYERQRQETSWQA